MTLLLAYSAILLLAVLVSALAHRTVLSTAVLFLVAGFVLGDGVTGVVSLQPQDEIVAMLAAARAGAGLGIGRGATQAGGALGVRGVDLTGVPR